MNPRDLAGYRAHTKARSTGVIVILVDAESQGINVEDGGKWALICDDHGSLLQDDKQSNLRGWLAHPEDWCEECREIFYD